MDSFKDISIRQSISYSIWNTISSIGHAGTGCFLEKNCLTAVIRVADDALPCCLSPLFYLKALAFVAVGVCMVTCALLSIAETIARAALFLIVKPIHFFIPTERSEWFDEQIIKPLYTHVVIAASLTAIFLGQVTGPCSDGMLYLLFAKSVHSFFNSKSMQAFVNAHYDGYSHAAQDFTYFKHLEQVTS